MLAAILVTWMNEFSCALRLGAAVRFSLAFRAQKLRSLVVITLSLALASCAGMKSSDQKRILIIDRSDVRTWNPQDVWIELATTPGSYCPRGMKEGAVMDDAHGKWVEDAWDHTRFYVPTGGTARYPQMYVEEMARVATASISRHSVPFRIFGWLVTGFLQSMGNLR